MEGTRRRISENEGRIRRLKPKYVSGKKDEALASNPEICCFLFKLSRSPLSHNNGIPRISSSCAYTLIYSPLHFAFCLLIAVVCSIVFRSQSPFFVSILAQFSVASSQHTGGYKLDRLRFVSTLTVDFRSAPGVGSWLPAAPGSPAGEVDSGRLQ